MKHHHIPQTGAPALRGGRRALKTTLRCGLYALLTLPAIILLATCNPAAPMTETKVYMPATSVPATPDNLIRLEWWDYYDLYELDEALDAAIARYEAEHPQIDIQRTIIRFDLFKQKLAEAALADDLPDIILVDSPDHQALAAQGMVEDLTGYIALWPDQTQYFEGAWASTLYQDRNYGVPFESNTTALFYNQDMLSEAGLITPPTTWETLRVYASQLTRGDRFGLCFATSADEGGTFTFLPFLWQAGGDIDTIGDAATVKALTFWNDMVNIDHSVPRGPMTQNEVRGHFSMGRCAMMINGPWAISEIAQDNVAFSWAVAPSPRDVAAVSILGGENFAVGAGGNVPEAWNVIAWMARPEHLKAPIMAVGLPNREDMAGDPPWTTDPNLSVFVDQIAIACPRDGGTHYPQISEQIWMMAGRVLDNRQTPEEAAETARLAIAPWLSQ